MAVLWLVALGWMYVVLAMAAAEFISPQGSWLGALLTFVLYGVAPLALVLYLLGTPHRRRARQRQERAAASAQQPDGRDHAPGDAVAAEREEA
jgi:membrane protein implicated in regulation of membrane protease activity